MVTPPHDLDAERQIIGSVLAFPGRVDLDDLTGSLMASDFYAPAHATAWSAIVDLHRAGEPVDFLTLNDRLRGRVDGVDLLAVQADAVGLRQAHVGIVQRHATARRLMAECTETLNALGEGGDPGEIAERLRTSLGSLDPPLLTGRLSAGTLESIIETGEALAPWVIPGLLRADWRAIIVGGEGRGKSVLLRQLAACAAQGVHPFRERRSSPVRVLLLDAENPAGAIAETGRPLRDQLVRTVGNDYDPTRLLVVRGAVDLRARADRLEVESHLRDHRPELVVAGPLYQMFARRSGERDDDSTEPILRLLDGWRRRFGFALVIEHHAPHGAPGSPREMRPTGSSVLRRWPEIGIGLASNGDSLNVERWRGDRMRNDWPQRLDRGTEWPWVGRWSDASSSFVAGEA